MSPRRMDISSLLRDPSPSDVPRLSDRPPRTIDALLQHPHTPDYTPASLLAILNPDHRAPFLGLDALVHVASEERRRMTALSLPDIPSDRDLSHDRQPRHYTRPFQDNSRPHKRSRDSCPSSPPRSPPPEPVLPGQPISPPSRHYPSASPTNNYPTLRRQPVPQDLDLSRSVPSPVNDTRVVTHSPLSFQHASPFFHAPHSTHSSPRNTSPHRLSPQYLCFQHCPSPIQARSFVPSSAEANPMSPHHGHGPRMAGGIEVLSNDSPSMRDQPRPDPSYYQTPERNLFMEQSVSGSHAEHTRHDPPNLSPLSAKLFSPDIDPHQVTAYTFKVETQEGHRERTRSHPHLPSVNNPTDDTNSIAIHGKETESFARHPLERHPIRMWEEQPKALEASSHVSPVRVPGTISGSLKEKPWLGVRERDHGERPAKEDGPSVLPPDVVKNVLTPASPTCKEPLPLRQPASGPLRTPTERTRLDSQVFLPTSGLQAHIPQASLLSSSALYVPASPVLDIHPKSFETQPGHQCGAPETQDTTISTPFTSSDPVVTERVLSKVELMLRPVDADTSLTAVLLPHPPFPEPTQPVLTSKEPRTTALMHANVLQGTSKSPLRQPLPVLSHSQDKWQPCEDTSMGLESKHNVDQEQPISGQFIMDVDEELLSLVDGPPARVVPAMSGAQIGTRLPPPTAECQATDTGIAQGSSDAFDGPSVVPSSHLFPKSSLMADEEKDRTSMPPPPARSKKAEKEKLSLASGAVTISKKKKDVASKPTAKSKQPPKPRAKPAPKPKAKSNAVDTSFKAIIPKSTVNVNARSRSTSVIPGTVDDIVPEPEANPSDKEDDKLYCICKTRYNEDRMMIACDRCDEWFHTLCVDIPDLEIDLVDQFVCPPCMQKHPQQQTTWRRRCLFGLQHENPSSSEACHKPSRGAFSKYCSDDCGIKYMRARITQWEKSGGARELLWESVKNATKREGVVVYATTNGTIPQMMDVDNKPESKPLDSVAKRRARREVEQLNTRLEEVVKERERMKRELDMVTWREKVVELASERAGKVDECGWDQRLCFGEEEWADFGPEVLESYEDERVKVELGDDAMPLDAVSLAHGEWWCTGKRKCERHAGWQKLRSAEVSFDKETKEGILLKLTTREREIRKRIEDILFPQSTGTLQAPLHPDIQVNGSETHTV